MSLSETFINTWSSDKAKGYIMIVLFLLTITGWGSVGLQRAEKIEQASLYQDTLKAAQIYADIAGEQYERLRTPKTPYRYHPSDPVKRVLLLPDKE